jgi:hypothetical protein
MKLTSKALLIALLGAGCGAPSTRSASPTSPGAPALSANVAPPCEPVAEAAFSVSSDLPSYLEASVDVGEDGKGYALFTTRVGGGDPPRGRRIVGRAFDLRSHSLGPVSTVDEQGSGFPQVVAAEGRIALAWLSGSGETKARLVDASGQLGPARTVGADVHSVLARSPGGFSLTSVTPTADACVLERTLLDTTLAPKGEPETLVRIAQANYQCLHSVAVAEHATSKGSFTVYRSEDFKTLVRLPAGEIREIPGADAIVSREIPGGVLGAWLSGSAPTRTLHVGRLGEAELASAVVPVEWRGWGIAIAGLGTDTVIVDERLQGRLVRGRELGAPTALASEGTNPRALSGDLLAWTSNLHDRNELVVARLACGAPSVPPAIAPPPAPLATPAPADPPAACRLRLDTDATLTTDGAKNLDRDRAPSLSVADGAVWVAWSDVVLSNKAFRINTSVERYDAATGKPLGARIHVDPGIDTDVAPVILGTTRGSAELLMAARAGNADLAQWSRRAVDATHVDTATPLLDPLARITRPALAPGSTPLLLWHGGDESALRVRRLPPGSPTLTLAERGTSGPVRALADKGDLLVAWRGESKSPLSEIGVGVSFARVAFDEHGAPRLVWRRVVHPDLIVGDLGELVLHGDHDLILPLPHLTEDATRFLRVSVDGAIEPDLVVPAPGHAAAADDSRIAVIDAKPKQVCVKLFDLDARPSGEPACFPTRTSFVRGAIAARWVGPDLWLASTEAPEVPAKPGAADAPADIVRLRRLVCAR